MGEGGGGEEMGKMIESQRRSNSTDGGGWVKRGRDEEGEMAECWERWYVDRQREVVWYSSVREGGNLRVLYR